MTNWHEKRHELWAACKNLREDQRAAIKDMLDAVDSIIDMISECKDLYLSDIRRLEDMKWKLYRMFPEQEPKGDE